MVPPHHEAWSDDFDDDEYPDEEELLDDESVDLLPCPECETEVYEDSERCPYCGAYITWSSSPWRGRTWWWVALGLLGVIATIVALALIGM